MSELKELQWQQQGNEVVINLINDNFEELPFILNEKIINFLASNTPKIYVLFVELNNHGEQSYLINFNDLKSIVSHQNSLKISTNKQKKEIQYEGVKSKGKFCIARGESYHERYINDTGWQHQRKYFDIYDVNEIKTAKKIETAVKHENIQPLTEKVESKQNTSKQISENKGGKLKECIKCAEIIPSKLEICPYCGANQNSLKQKDEDIVDISI